MSAATEDYFEVTQRRIREARTFASNVESRAVRRTAGIAEVIRELADALEVALLRDREYVALLEVESVLVAARPLLGMSVADSLGARTDRALDALDKVRRG